MQKKRNTIVGIVGLGYVGIPTALALGRKGTRIIGIDINRKRVDMLNKRKSFIAEISDETLAQSLKNFKATTDWGEIKKCTVVLITVPTPLTKNKTPDTTAIEEAGKKIARNLKPGTLVVLESTTYPGTTEELLKPILEKSGLVAGKDFFLAFAPERIDPGNKKFAFHEVPKVVGGINKKSTDLAVKFYRTFIPNAFPVANARTAEMTKLLENIFRLVNISLVNELKMLADKMDIDFWEVIEAAKTKPYGFMPFYPGPGIGGHCIPLDPFYLSWKARELNFFTRFIDLAGEINELMPHHVVTKVGWTLNKHKKSLNGAKILALGVAYKKDIDDPRESPALEVIWDLKRKGAIVDYHDPYIPHIDIRGEIMESVPLSTDALKKADCVLILTNHSSFDYGAIAKHAKLIVDTRGAIKTKEPHIFF
jgi:UDP-N-acetyl-D-glucosamine dehydrogenase